MKSVPLSVQLVLTFVGLIAGTAALLTVAAYHSSHATLETAARQRVHIAAQNREEMLQRLLVSRQERAEGFLASVDSICGEAARRGRIAWELGCARTALEEFRATERASGALLIAGGRIVAVSGVARADTPEVPGTLAEIVPRNGEHDYVMRASTTAGSLVVRFPTSDLQPFFEDRSGLGAGGEVFLTAQDGVFLTPARYSPSPMPTGASVAESPDECADGPSERIDIDYRGQLTIHGVRPVPLIVGGGCVDAHLPYDEALAPAEDLRTDLLARGIILVVIAALVSIGAAYSIASPVRRLAASARALESGDFTGPIDVAGPSEVRSLARAFSASAASIAQLVAREQAARHDAEAANRAKDDFLATVSHELRTPLTAMLGWARLLQQGRLDAAGARRAAGAIERSAEAQARLVDDLLDISRITAGRLRLRRSAIVLASPIEAAVDAVRPLAEEKRVSVTLTMEAAAHVFGDAQRLQQVVWNLLTNAVKFTPSGGSVSVRLRRVNGRAELTVTDTGAGISPEFLPHVFERFRQANAAITRTHAGLGLGLAIVRHLVKLHGGEVKVESAGEGLGATFTVTLPLYDGPLPSRETHARPIVPSARPLDHVPVLLVDDDDATLQVVQAILEDAGAVVATATSAADARRAIDERRPAVLISDIGMPNEDGYSLMRSLKEQHTAVPAIALTAYARREDAQEAYAAGYEVHLPKPVNAHELVDAVASLTAGGERGA